MITAVVLIRAEKGAVPRLGETIAAVPGVMRTQTHVAFKAYSRHDLESMFAVGADKP